MILFSKSSLKSYILILILIKRCIACNNFFSLFFSLLFHKLPTEAVVRKKIFWQNLQNSKKDLWCNPSYWSFKFHVCLKDSIGCVFLIIFVQFYSTNFSEEHICKTKSTCVKLLRLLMPMSYHCLKCKIIRPLYLVSLFSRKTESGKIRTITHICNFLLILRVLLTT